MESRKKNKRIERIQVVRNTYFDEYGKPSEPTFYVRFKRGWRWRWVKHTECGWGDIDTVRTQFKSEEAAADFIEKVLVPGKTYDGWEETITLEL